MRRQSGFTLVEIAIVLVVIGLLLGGVLKGQELVMNAQIRNSINDYNNVAWARFAYQDRYRAIPGDDNTASARWTETSATDGDGDGTLEGDWQASGNEDGSDGSTEETVRFWHHLRNDNLIAGSRDGTAAASYANPQNAFNGLTGVQLDAFDPSNNGIFGDVICQSAIPAKAAILIDTRIDDGTGGGEGSDTGGLVAGAVDTDGSYDIDDDPAADYNSAAKYLMCRQL